MIRYLSSAIGFSAAHRIEEEDHPCDKNHGHRWRVIVEMESTDRMVKRERTMAAILRELGAELHLRDLNVMIAPSRTDCEGVAAWFMEKLLLHYPVSEVTVWQDDEIAATLRR